VAQELEVDEVNSEVALGSEAGQGLGHLPDVETAHQAQAEPVGPGLDFGGDVRADAVKAGVLDGGQLAEGGPSPARCGIVEHRPRGGAHHEPGLG
jgi:hypothetical protein